MPDLTLIQEVDEGRVRFFRTAIILFLLSQTSSLLAARSHYLGAVGGLATLSADGRSVIAAASSQSSSYKPENGPAVNLFGGWAVSNYVSLQANYIWNRNDLTLVSTAFSPAGANAYQQARNSTEQSVIGDVLVYTRKRGSVIRPYLSGGTGVVHFSSAVRGSAIIIGSRPLPPPEFSATRAALRVAVGVDIRLRAGWALRYSFSETVSHSPVSDQLLPPGRRSLKNFQNLFGFVRYF